LHSSGNNLTFRKYQVNNGLSENTVQAILQDRQGFLWFGTKDGLNRFDGNEYRTFRNNYQDKRSIGNNFIRSIFEDTNGKLWIGTDNKIYIYNPTTEDFSLFEAKTDKGISVNSAVTAICSENENTIWIGTMTQGAFCYNKNLNKLVQFTENDSLNSLNSNLVWRIYKDYSETIWIGTRGGMSRFNRETMNFRTYKPANNTNTAGDNEILSVFEDSDGDIWMGTWSGGLFKMDKQSQTFTNFFNIKSSPYVTKIRAINEYEKNKLLIGSDDGLYLMEKSSGAVQRIDDPRDPSSLSDQNVYCIYDDREGGIWIGTYFGGVNYLSANRNAIEHYYPGYSDSYLSGKAISEFCEDEKGNLWIATEDGGLNYFDVQKKQFRKIMPQKTGNGLSYHNLHSLILDGDNLWIGTFSSGIDVMNVKTNTFKNYPFESDNENSIDDNCVFSLYKNKNAEIFAGTPFGLSKYNRKKNHFDRINEVRSFVYDMQEDSYGLFWVTTYGDGVFQYNPTTKKWKNYLHIPGSQNSLSFNKVIDVFMDDKQRLWFATEGRGICKYNYETDDFTTIDESNGLPNNVAYGILDDKYGNIWVSTNMGITKINPETLEMKTYTKEDGLQSNQFNYRSSYKTRNGVFYFGGINGFNAFHPDNLKVNNYIPPVAITSFELLDDENLTKPDTMLRIAINRDKKITLKHNQASFKIGFISMSYQAVEKNRYSCIMEDIEQKWRSIGNQKSLTFSNLNPGEYTFKVKGSNNDGIWNTTGDYLHIEILPPFWKSNKAFMLYIFLFLSGLFLIIRTLVRNSRRRHKQKIDEIRIEKEKEIYDSKIIFFTNIAHEIRTPVSLIKAPLECIVNSQEYTPETRENLSVIERNTDKLLVLVNQLLDFRKIEENKYRLSFIETNVNDFLNDIYMSFKATGIQNNITITMFLPQKLVIANIDKDALNKVISNLLSNALKFAKHKIEIFLTEDKKTSMMEIKISDDGPGIKAELTEKVFEPFFQINNGDNSLPNNGTGIGLALARQLVERHSGEIFVSNENSGCCNFTVRIPTMLPVSPEDVIKEEDTATMVKLTHLNHHHPDNMYILVVEDNEELQNFLEKNLKKDFNVLVAGNGNDALKILNESAIDLIVSDIVMPGIDGLELTRQIKQNEQYCHIPVILLSARTNISTKIEGLEYGADIYIEKPFSLVYLKAQISSLIENRMRVLEKFSKSPFIPYGTIANNKRDEEFLYKMNTEIEKNILDVNFSIEKLAHNLSMSRSNLQRKIKGISGMVPNDYIRVYRLKKAATLLMKEDYRINEICYIVGFNSGSYFAKCFQKQFGVLPKDFVKSGDQETHAINEI
jgi:ligand-binding sensor domain-containing protein/signal transduction histidine kinase/DNA-binding response OmpR family regulator